MQLIKAPSSESPKFKTVFLAGGISNCPDWQSEVSSALKECSVSIFNPRRDVFPSEPKAIEEQIRWEFERLRSSDVLSFWFPEETLNPVTLFEFGAAMERAAPLVVGIDPLYKRRVDVEIQMKLRRPEIHPVYSLSELAEVIKKHL
jgi:hypothetical protein